MAVEITEEQREQAKLDAILAGDTPWLSESGCTSFEHEQAGAMGVITALSLLLLLQQPITAEVLSTIANKVAGATEEELRGKPPVEGPFN